MPADIADGPIELKTVSLAYEQQPIKLYSHKKLKKLDSNPVRLFFNPKHDLAADEIRVVLRWNEHPRDLDLHCVSSSGDHVYFSRKSSQDGSINLDVDVMSGKGPETMTIKLKSGVQYWLSAHHYSGDQTLSESGAVVAIYGLPGMSELSIPSGVASRVAYSAGQGYWRMLSINPDRTFSVKNDIFQADSGASSNGIKW
jgi:hypothetical protein